MGGARRLHDALSEQGFVSSAGPIGEGDGDNALLVVDAPDEGAIRARLAEGPLGRGDACHRVDPALVGADRG